jgi:hypothetical protein
MASAYLTTGNLTTAGNQKKWTFSAWIKKTKLGGENGFMGYWSTDANYFIAKFQSDQLVFGNVDNSAFTTELKTSAVYKDTSAFYHVVYHYNSAEATSSNRAKMWVNGEQITSFATEQYPSQNANTKLPNNGYPLTIGLTKQGASNYYFDGILAHVHFCDGYAYEASDFGETDSTTGIWKPKTSPSVSYGTNGFFLDFADSSAYGNDVSGQDNDLSVGGGTITQTIDTPSNVFATWNVLAAHSSNKPTFSNGNTTVVGVDTSSQTVSSTLAVSKGKYYCEMKLTQEANASSSIPNFGIIDAASLHKARNQELISYTSVVNSYAGRVNSANMYADGADTGNDFSDTPDVGDIIGLALDLDSAQNTLKYYLNGTLIGTQNIDNDEYVFACSIKDDTNGNAGQVDVNFGNGYFGTTAVSSAGTNAGIGTFEYDVPSGYKALCTKNINAQEYS